jgi:hypothetical protein
MLDMCLITRVFLQANSCQISKMKKVGHNCVNQEEEKKSLAHNTRQLVFGIQQIQSTFWGGILHHHFYMSSAVVKPFILLPSWVKVVDKRICLTRYFLFSNSKILTSLNSIWSSVAGVFPSFSIRIPLLRGNGTGIVAVPSMCLQRPLNPNAFCSLG